MSSSLFYITISPRRAIGIHEAIGATIVCLFKSDVIHLLRDEGAVVFCLEEESHHDVSTINDTAELLTHPLVTNYLSSFDEVELIVFKPRKKIARICEKQGWILLASDPELCRRLEDKIEFFELAKKYDLPVPRSETMLLGDKSFEHIVDSFGEPFVFQKRRGFAGASTKLVRSKEDFETAYAEGTHVKVSEFVDGPTFTINCCLTGDGRLRKGYLWEQVTSGRAGVESWTPFEMGTIGVVPADVSDRVLGNVKGVLEGLGKVMFELGYRGFFGVDLMMQEGKPLIIEVNARLTATVGFESAVMACDGENALIAEHVKAFESELLEGRLEARDDPSVSQSETSPLVRGESNCSFSGFSQLTVHSTRSGVHRFVYQHVSGIYQHTDDGWKLRKATLSLSLLVEGEVLLLTKNKGMKVRHGSDYAQMIIRGRALTEDGSVNEMLVDFFERVIQNYKVRPKDFWKGRYGRVDSGPVDIVARPFSSWSGVTERAVDRLRQSQLLKGEVFELLGEFKGSCLVRRFDGVVGWVEKLKSKNEKCKNGFWTEVEVAEGTDWRPDVVADRSIEEFFEEWEGHPYLWGGVTKAGVDCSGLTQAYFWQVRGMVIPKHSKDQRMLGEVLDIGDVENGDLVFMVARNKMQTPHVGVWWNFGIWSACLKDKAVVWKTLEGMEVDYVVEGVRRI